LAVAAQPGQTHPKLMAQMALIPYLAPLRQPAVVAAHQQKALQIQRRVVLVAREAAVLGLEQRLMLVAMETLPLLVLRKATMAERALMWRRAGLAQVQAVAEHLPLAQMAHLTQAATVALELHPQFLAVA
jgi:hypothetical protein